MDEPHLMTTGRAAWQSSSALSSMVSRPWPVGLKSFWRPGCAPGAGCHRSLHGLSPTWKEAVEWGGLLLTSQGQGYWAGPFWCKVQ